MNGFSIVLPALCLNLYHDHIRQYSHHLKERLSFQSDNASVRYPIPVDIPEHEQIDDNASGSISTSIHVGSTSTHRGSKVKRLNIQSILNDGLIHIGIGIIFMIFMVTYQMLCCYYWDIYNQISRIIYPGYFYFIINELVFKLFAAMLLLNTILHIININNHWYNPNYITCYGYVTVLIKPQHVVLIIFMICVEINMLFIYSQKNTLLIWNYVWISLYALIMIYLLSIGLNITKKIKQIWNEQESELSYFWYFSNIWCVVDGIILLVLVIFVNILLVYSDYRNWTIIRQLSCNIFNLSQFKLIYDLKWTFENKKCYKYVKCKKNLRSTLMKLIVFNLYNICYTLVLLQILSQDIGQ